MFRLQVLEKDLEELIGLEIDLGIRDTLKQVLEVKEQLGMNPSSFRAELVRINKRRQELGLDKV